MTVLDIEAIERDSSRIQIGEVVAYLSDALGQQATAYLAGLKDVKMIGKWVAGTAPRPIARQRLRHAYTAARMLVEAYDTATAEAWFFGSNSRLDDEAPAWVLRHGRSIDDFRLVVPAAKAFARSPE